MRLILLTEHAFFEPLAAPLRAAGNGLEVALAQTLPELERAIGTAPARILSVGSGVIVPRAVLAKVPAYNLHPGPPQYPGLFPSVFALYDGAPRFGITLHEMTTVVDAGPIVAVDEFAIDPGWNRLTLDAATFLALQRMLAHLAPQITDLKNPLARTKHSWTGRKRTRKDFEELCRLPENATAEEFARRYRAVGEGPDHALTLTRFGRTFRLESDKRGDVVRGGQFVRP